MNRATTMTMLAVLAGGLMVQPVLAQQVMSQQVMSQQVMSQQVMSQQAAQPAPRQVRVVQPTRSYRSYSVNPARGDVRRNGPHSGEATWRHAGAKPSGHYSTGR
jgi:hypothetical protein